VSPVVDNTKERLVKSPERIRDLGEVFTPSNIVQEMLDLLPPDTWNVHPAPTFLEPACGDGNFLIAILERKLTNITKCLQSNKLPAGNTLEAAQFHALEALSSIYAVDISEDNIIGGTPGHEIGARSRLLAMFTRWNQEVLNKQLANNSIIFRSASWIVEHNFIVGNMLPLDDKGKPTTKSREKSPIPLIEYFWNPAEQVVELRKTTIGDIMEARESEASSTQSLFGLHEPTFLWRGKAANLFKAEHVEAPKLNGPARNGAKKR
jgi:hypothetical protein